MYKVLIIEDEKPAADWLKQLILKFDPQITVMAVIDSVTGAIEWFQQNPAPDLAFMDIQLADGLSFDIFERTKILCPVIFTTAYDEYAIKAFKVNSIDYLLKPITLTTLEKSLDKLKRLTGGSVLPAEIHQLIASLTKDKTYKTHFLICLLY